MLIIQYLKGITHFALYYLDANTTILGNKYEHFNDLFKFQKQRVKMFNADTCGITLI